MPQSRNRTFPFSGVDAVMRALDEPSRPQTIHLEVAVDGLVDGDRLRSAVGQATAAHPMTRARQRPASPFDLHDSWEVLSDVGADTMEVRTASDPAAVDAARDAFSSRHLDVTSGPPFRLLLLHEADGTSRVLLSATHVAFDGVGCLRLLQSVSRRYAGEEDPAPALDPQAAREAVEALERARLASGPARRAAKPPSLQPPTRLARGPAGGGSGFGILNVGLGVDEVATGGRATVNDVLHTALQLAIARWNEARHTPCGRITVMMPVNQRPAAWRDDVVANLVLSGTVASSAGDRRSPRGLLELVRSQTAHVKAHGVGGTSDPLPRRTPVLLRRLLPHVIDAVADRAADTAVLSNLGAVADPPWFGLGGRGLWFNPPPRRPLFLTVGASTAGDDLGISLRWCTEDLDRAGAGTFADLLVEAIAAVRATGSAEGT